MKKAIFCALLPLLVQGFQAAWAEEGSAVRKRAADEEEAKKMKLIIKIFMIFL